MKTGAASPHELTYCLNVHAGESWEQNLDAIRTHVLPLKERVAPGQRFGLGLRLSHRAAQTLVEPGALASFRAFLEEHDLYVLTINAFPYGAFHRARVKESVYQPDWRTDERRTYTLQVADIAAALSSPGDTVSISTVPGSYGAWMTQASDVTTMVRHLMDVVAHLVRIDQVENRHVTLGLEPEPDCFLESTDDVIAFFDGPVRQAGIPHLAKLLGTSASAAADFLGRHLGICFDTCHLALQFEALDHSLRRLVDAGVLISKVQLSSALNARYTPEAREALAAFTDPVYLHQVKVKRDAGPAVLGHADLETALPVCSPDESETWRVHVHVPLYFESYGPLASTSHELTPAFFDALRELEVAHLEIETYTFDVLPPELSAMGVGESVAREYAWVLERVGGASISNSQQGISNVQGNVQ